MKLFIENHFSTTEIDWMRCSNTTALISFQCNSTNLYNKKLNLNNSWKFFLDPSLVDTKAHLCGVFYFHLRE